MSVEKNSLVFAINKYCQLLFLCIKLHVSLFFWQAKAGIIVAFKLRPYLAGELIKHKCVGETTL